MTGYSIEYTVKWIGNQEEEESKAFVTSDWEQSDKNSLESSKSTVNGTGGWDNILKEICHF